MALKRYVGPAEAVYVAVAGEPLGHLRQGEVLDVPGDLAALVVWPDGIWEDAGPE